MESNREVAVDSTHPILLFDGVCNLCNGTVQWIIERDRTGRVHFASLQSELGAQLLEAARLPKENLQSVMLYENGHIHTYSDAPLRVARYLDGGWSVLQYLAIVPRPIRDVVYRWIARNRYRWFGKRDACMIPTPELRHRFEN